MNRAIGVVLIVIGALLLFWGYQSGQALTSEISETLTGTPTNETMWFYVGGAACVIVGVFLALFQRGRS